MHTKTKIKTVKNPIIIKNKFQNTEFGIPLYNLFN
jgi:hypothetical protein